MKVPSQSSRGLIERTVQRWGVGFRLAVKPLRKIFSESAAAYRAAFPEALAGLFVTSEAERIYVSPAIVAHLTKNVKRVGLMIERRKKYMEPGNTTGAAGDVWIKNECINYLSLRAYSSGKFVSTKFSGKMNRIATFDHEIGHLVVEGGLGAGTQRGECAADAYAALRHIQRFGAITDIFEWAPYAAAYHAIFEKRSDHYTSAVLQKVANIQREGKIDIRSLSLKETAALAGDIAARYSLPHKTLRRIYAAFAPVRECNKSGAGIPAGVIRKVIEVMYANMDDHDVYRASKLYLSHPRRKGEVDHLARNFSDLQVMLDLMERREKDTGFILNAADAIDAGCGRTCSFKADLALR